MKSEIRPVKCWYDKKRRAKSPTYDDSTGTVAYAQCRYLCCLPFGCLYVVVLWVHLGIESQGKGANIVNICIKVNGGLAVVERNLTHDAAHFKCHQKWVITDRIGLTQSNNSYNKVKVWTGEELDAVYV